jgi:hypothetical protein
MSKNDWPAETPQEVIDEIEANLDGQTDEYKEWLRQSIGEVKKTDETKAAPDESTLLANRRARLMLTFVNKL